MRVAIATLGCKINQYDSAAIQARLERENHRIVAFDEEADCYVVNSCTVTDRADWEARQLVRRAKRRSPAARVVVTGCYAQVSPDEVAAVEGVDFVVGLNRIEDLVRFVAAPAEVAERIAVSESKSERRVNLLSATKLPGHTRAFVKVQEGCDYACTYCIIPAARGRSRSVPPEGILRQIAALAEEGIVEAVLTGIHLGGYGRDLTPKTDLTSLVERIAAARLVPRLRLSSLDPREVPERLLRVLAQSDIVCDHLHICLQAGADEILKAMRRNYDTAYYRDVVERARALVPSAALGTDLIVGFPGESDELFARSLEFVDSLPLTYLHVFPYSARRGTPAARFAGQIPPGVKKQRARIARALGARKKSAFYRRFVGAEVAVLFEREGGADGWLKGYSRNYLPVRARAARERVNQEVQVRITGLEGDGLVGEVVAGR
ncbi:MAG TPA: tRNA (N(6)-L-threonylcarbamoyladenosine(37)-C(2))-methylthiotransferase MtaB [Candidatus Acidoferrales bacterium]|nr:tRNA (N(6)-L-threonylcarbamoyladenosine(37)-C(2))-methylthiotransferase MtaB [Candidatus Acidoferrales bacterium]